MLNTTELYYFSPTGGTKKAGQILGEAVAKEATEVDLGNREAPVPQPESGLVIAAAPVFGGRIPGIVSEKLKKLAGKGKKAVTLVVYGNRAYEDALLELNRCMEAQGFQILASAALVARHSIVPEVAAGRPDPADREEIREFSRKVLEKWEQGVQDAVTVPGNYPYKKEMQVPMPPISLSNCNQCGACEKICPAGAIRIRNGAVETDAGSCMLCMACTAVCKRKARVLPPALQEQMTQKLGALRNIRKENEFFL